MAWVLLAYRLPRDPSTPRSALWRKLRRLGAVQVLDGLAALPLDARNRELLEWLADEVVESGGAARSGACAASCGESGRATTSWRRSASSPNVRSRSWPRSSRSRSDEVGD